jgi:hypothetical protein
MLIWLNTSKCWKPWYPAWIQDEKRNSPEIPVKDAAMR